MLFSIPWWIYVGFFLGIIFSFYMGFRSGRHCRTYGTIRIESNKDNTRDVVRFILDYDLDWIRSQKQIVMTVEDLSQKTQAH